MDIVLDANELFPTIIASGKKRQTKRLDLLSSQDIKFFAPYRLLAELEKNREEVRLKSGFSHKDFNVFVEIVKLKVEPIPLESFLDKISEAKEISPHLKDTEFFALALKFDIPIWSEEKSFKTQNKVEIFNTEELHKKIFPENINST